MTYSWQVCRGGRVELVAMVWRGGTRMVVSRDKVNRVDLN